MSRAKFNSEEMAIARKRDCNDRNLILNNESGIKKKLEYLKQAY